MLHVERECLFRDRIVDRVRPNVAALEQLLHGSAQAPLTRIGLWQVQLLQVVARLGRLRRRGRRGARGVCGWARALVERHALPRTRTVRSEEKRDIGSQDSACCDRPRSQVSDARPSCRPGQSSRASLYRRRRTRARFEAAVAPQSSAAQSSPSRSRAPWASVSNVESSSAKHVSCSGLFFLLRGLAKGSAHAHGLELAAAEVAIHLEATSLADLAAFVGGLGLSCDCRLERFAVERLRRPP